MLEIFSVRAWIHAGVVFIIYSFIYLFYYFIHFSEERRWETRHCLHIWWFLCHPTSGVFCLQNTMDGNAIFAKQAKASRHLTCRHWCLMWKVAMDLYCSRKQKWCQASFFCLISFSFFIFVFVFKESQDWITCHNVTVWLILQAIDYKFSSESMRHQLWFSDR